MRQRGGRVGFTLWSGTRSSSHRSWERVIGAARGIAGDSGAAVRVVDDDSGQTWEISPSGQVGSPHP